MFVSARFCLLAAFGLAFAGAASAVESTPPLSLTNLGLHAASFEATDDGNFVFLGVDEAQQGGLDLNGDGDAFDQVLHVHDVQTTVTTNIGLAITGNLAVSGSRVVFELSENGHGGVDWNLDGDAFDSIPQILDATTLTITDPGIAGSYFPPMIDGDYVAFEVLEADQAATDLNGDGDVNDSVLHVFDLVTGVTTNTFLAAKASFAGATPRLSGKLVTVLVSEANQGMTDLNGDGDMFDSVAHAIDLTTNAVTNLGLASPWSSPAEILGGAVYVLVPEAEQANTDLNGDGDRFDLVPHVYRNVTPPIMNLGVAGFGAIHESGTIVFSVAEASHGFTDLNSDGDASDLVLHTFNLKTDVLQNLGVAAVAPLADQGRFAFGVYEGSQGNTDLNGDGDAADWVLHVHDVTTGVTENHQIEGLPTAFQRGRIGYLLTEFQAGLVDLNGDGDVWISEQVPHVFDLDKGTVLNLGVAGFMAEGTIDRMLVKINEQIDGGIDRNGDGDAHDDVLTVFEGDHGTTIDFALDGSEVHVAGEQLTFAVSEAANGGVDLNADGDANDWVLHVAHLTPGVCGTIQPYGSGCGGWYSNPPELLMRGCIQPGQAISSTIVRGMPRGYAFVSFGRERAELAMSSQCSLLISPPLPLFLGPVLLSAFGSTRIDAMVPVEAPTGMVRMQAFIDASGPSGPAVTNAIEFEIE